jgi:uncharacterized protein with HEPN domain
MRTNKLLLQDILCCCDEVLTIVKGFDQASFVASDVVRSAAQLKLIIFGEASARLTDEFKNRHSEIPRKNIIAYRKFAAHAYFQVETKRVWETVNAHVPPLRDAVAAILAKEFPA